MKKTKTCPTCYGAGTVTDTGMSIAIGVAIGGGYFPMTKTCTTCWGAGNVEDN